MNNSSFYELFNKPGNVFEISGVLSNELANPRNIPKYTGMVVTGDDGKFFGYLKVLGHDSPKYPIVGRFCPGWRDGVHVIFCKLHNSLCDCCMKMDLGSDSVGVFAHTETSNGNWDLLNNGSWDGYFTFYAEECAMKNNEDKATLIDTVLSEYDRLLEDEVLKSKANSFFIWFSRIKENINNVLDKYTGYI